MEEHKESELKVVDRRRFIQVGDRIEENPEAAAAPPSPEPPKVSAAPPQQATQADPQAGTQTATKAETEQSRRASAQRRADQAAAGLPPADFLTLVEFLAQQVSMYMGEPDPMGRAIPANFPLAAMFIDLLGVLQEKTKGNLTLEESQLLDQLLYTLRLQYVQKRR